MFIFYESMPFLFLGYCFPINLYYEGETPGIILL
jgi:hypothetical protein